MKRLLRIATLIFLSIGIASCSSSNPTESNLPPVPVEPKMVSVDGGAFSMGSIVGIDNEQPVHIVSLSSFYIGKYEVTQKEWLNTMRANPSFFTGNGSNPVEQVSWYDILVYCNKRSMAEGFTPVYSINGSTNPVNWGAIPTSSNKIWDSAVCNWSANGYRLPSEAEWEYSAKESGKGSNAYDYSGSYQINDVSWYVGNSYDVTHIVGSKVPNKLGLYDMSGNAVEWVWDLFGSYSSNATTNPHGVESGQERVMRGGSYLSAAKNCQVVHRSYGDPSLRYKYLGFRLCRTL